MDRVIETEKSPELGGLQDKRIPLTEAAATPALRLMLKVARNLREASASKCAIGSGIAEDTEELSALQSRVEDAMERLGFIKEVQAYKL